MGAPYIIALDPATNTGLCEGRVGSTPILLAERFRVSRDEADEDIFGRATGFFATFLKTRSPDLIAIEAPIMATWGKTNAQTTSITRGLFAIFTGIAKCKGIPIIRADIGTWRKYFLGRGNLKGSVAKAECLRLCAQLGWSAPTHDAAESAGIWSWACSQAAPANAQRIEPLFAAHSNSDAGPSQRAEPASSSSAQPKKGRLTSKGGAGPTSVAGENPAIDIPAFPLRTGGARV